MKTNVIIPWKNSKPWQANIVDSKAQNVEKIFAISLVNEIVKMSLFWRKIWELKGWKFWTKKSGDFMKMWKTFCQFGVFEQVKSKPTSVLSVLSLQFTKKF